MERKMTPAKQVSAVEDFIVNYGTQAKHTQVLELVAKLNGAKSWNQLKKSNNTNKPEALVLEEGDSAYRINPGFRSAWVTAGNISVYICKNDEGVSVDLFPTGQESCGSEAGTWWTYQEAQDAGTFAFDLSKEKTLKMPKAHKVKPDLLKRACLELLAAYASNDDCSGSIDWDDLDKAFATAKEALGSSCYERLVAELAV